MSLSSLESRFVSRQTALVLVFIAAAIAAPAILRPVTQRLGERQFAGQASLITRRSATAITMPPALMPKSEQVSQSAARVYGQLPLSFEANQGQTNREVKFIARGQGYGLFLTANKAILKLAGPAALHSSTATAPTEEDGESSLDKEAKVVTVSFHGAKSISRPVGIAALPGKSNYFIGSHTRNWRRDVPQYARVRYPNIYPGIDLIYYGNQGQLEYDLVVAPNAHPGLIRMGFSGTECVNTDAAGNLLLRNGAGEVQQPKPIAYQQINGERHEISAGYRVKDNIVSFELGEYDKNLQLVIDPVLLYSSFLGGNGSDQGLGIAVDALGSAYLTGSTTSTDFPLAGSLQSTKGAANDAFVVKLNPAGTAIVYATYLGSNGDDTGQAIAVDAQGRAYVVGLTGSSGFPVVGNAFQDSNKGNVDGFLARLSPSGSTLEYSSCLGGNNTDQMYGVAVDSSNRAYVVGLTDSTNFNGIPLQRNGSPIYKSTNGGASWSGSSSGVPASLVNCLTQDPVTAAVIYAGTNRGVFKSTDAGANWTLTGTSPPIAAPFSATAVTVDPTNSNTVYVGSNTGVYKSTNGALTYTQKNSGLGSTSVFALAVDPGTPSILYAGTQTGISKSTNGGDTWVALNIGNSIRVSRIAIDPTQNPATTIYLGTNGRGMLKTTNGGTLWTTINSGALPNFTSINALAMDPLNPSTLYVGYGPVTAGLVKTIDGGGSWTNSNTGLVPIGGTFGPNVNTFAIDPVTTSTLYASTSGGAIYKSVDSGANWNPSSSGFLSTGATAIVIDRTNPAILYSGTSIGTDVIAIRFNSADQLDYLMTFGGDDSDDARGVAVEADGSAYIVGSTNSRNLPTVSAFQAVSGGNSDAYVAKLNSSGSGFSYLTYLGGTGFEQGRGVAVRGGSAYVTGSTSSLNFPLVNPLSSPFTPAETDAFVTKLNPAGNGLDFSSYLGGEAVDQGFAIAVDSSGSVYVTGATNSLGFPIVVNAAQPTISFSNDAFMTKISIASSSILYSTYLGGSGTDSGNSIAVDNSGNAYITGNTSSPDFPITNSFQSAINAVDAFVTKIGPGVDLQVTMTDAPDPAPFGNDLTYTINLTNSGDLPATAVTVNDPLPTGATFVSATSNHGSCSGSATVTCNLGTLNAAESATVTIAIKPPATRSISNTVTATSNETDAQPANNSATATTTVDFANLSLVKTTAQTQAAPGGNLAYILTVTNKTGGTIANNVTVTDNLPAGLTFVSCSAFGGSCFASGNNVTATLPTLAVGGSAAIVITASINPSVATGTQLTNSASVLASPPDPQSADNTATATTSVTALPITPRGNGKIAFAADRAFTPVAEPSGVYTVNPDGTNETLFPNLALGARRPSWSPDGTRLASQTGISGTNQISLINADGTGLLQVAQNISSFSRNITWSPSGNLIAFIGEGVSFKPETVRAINFAFTDGRGTYQLPNSPNFLLSVDWSPDGSRFVYATDREIFSMNIDGTGRRQLTTAIQNPNFSTTDSDPRWSPDGARILFTRLSNGLSDLYVMNADGTGLSRLLNINGTTDGSWSPDGTKVVYAQQNEIYTSDNVGATQRLTNNIYYEFTPDWQPVVVANPTPTPSPTPTFSISGHIDNPSITTQIKLSGTSTGLIGLDINGDYIFVNLRQGGRYTVTPTSLFGRFTPGSLTVSNLQKNETGLNFTGIPVSYVVKGRVTDTLGQPISGQSIGLSRFGALRSVTTDAAGFYSFINVFPGDFYQVGPSNRPFDPVNLTFSVSSDVTANFIVAQGAQVYAIGGRPTDVNGNALVGLLVTLDGARKGATRTDINGNFAFANLPAGQSYSVTLAGAGFNFPVLQQNISSLTSDQFLTYIAANAQPTVQFSSATRTVGEGDQFVDLTLTRTGNLAAAGAVDYQTADVTGSERADYTASYGTVRFAAGESSRTIKVLITDDAVLEGNRTFTVTLTGGSGVRLGSANVATVTITDNDSAASQQNPIDDSRTFVIQQYADFLNRQPDPSGLDFWTDQIEGCGSDQQCRETKRINVSAAFFLSIEFQNTGYLVYRMHHAAFGTGEKLRLKNFLGDTQELGQGVVVGQGAWEQQLEANKLAFAADFVLRSEFLMRYPLSMSAAQFVDMLNANAGGPLSQSERDQLVADLAANTRTRAQVLRVIAEDPDLVSAQFNRAFVLMQFYGYLRRNPNDPQDSDYSGFDFWLSKLNQFNGNFVNADMVKAFISSAEYRQRFGQ